MRTHAIVIATVVFGAGLASAQHGMGRGGAMPAGAAAHGPAQAHGKAADAPGAPRMTQENNVAARLEKNPALAGRLAPMLPAGVTAEQAAAGFKNWGQFVAALQVSKNLNIPFMDLKSRMTGTQHVSLGKAVHELRPDLQEEYVKASVRTAEREAKHFDREARQTLPAAPQTTD